MFKGSRAFALVAACLGVLSSNAVLAEDTDEEGPVFGSEIGGSTLGAFVAVDMEVNRQVHLRAPLYFGSVSQVRDVNGNTIDGQLRAQSASFLADYYIADTGLRVSGGLSFGGYEVDGAITNPILGGRVYAGDYTMQVKQSRNIAPVVAVGFRQQINESWGFMAEVGARLTSATLTTTGQENLSATDRVQFDADIRQANDDLRNRVNAIPFISVGATFRF